MEPLTSQKVGYSQETMSKNKSLQEEWGTAINPPGNENKTVASQADYRYCREIMRSASRNYTFASYFFPRNKLPHVEALYALMRIGDDRVDVSHSGFKDPLQAIDNWEKLYWDAFVTGGSPEPVLRAYLDTAYQFDIPPDLMAPYFRAMRDDLTITRFPTFEDLLYYMEGSAMTVGRAMIRILGVRSPYRIEDVTQGADSLSIAMQLSNFWRDIGHDWGIGRVYLPLEDMEHYKYSEDDLANQVINQNLIDLLEFEIERTGRYYQTAKGYIPKLSNGKWAVWNGLEIYRAILTGIQKNHYDVFTKKAGANTIQKAGITIKNLRYNFN